MGINQAMEEQDRLIREALASAPRSLVRFAPEKGKIDYRLKRMNERKPRKPTEDDIMRAAKLLEEAESTPEQRYLAALEWYHVNILGARMDEEGNIWPKCD